MPVPNTPRSKHPHSPLPPTADTQFCALLLPAVTHLSHHMHTSSDTRRRWHALWRGEGLWGL